MEKRNCPNCIVEGQYCFKEEINKIVSDTEKNQNEEKLFENAAEIQQKIANERKIARDNCCHEINNIDPDYPGKNLL